jgi:hypothetical protein
MYVHVYVHMYEHMYCLNTVNKITLLRKQVDIEVHANHFEQALSLQKEIDTKTISLTAFLLWCR